MNIGEEQAPIQVPEPIKPAQEPVEAPNPTEPDPKAPEKVDQ